MSVFAAFALTAAVMLLVALAWVVLPLLRPRQAEQLASDTSNLAILRDQRAELDADLANGVITPAMHEQAMVELTERVAEDVRDSPAAPAPIPIAGAWTAAIVAAALPITAIVLYVILGSHEAFAPTEARAPAEPGRHDISPQKVAEMAEKLAARLEKDPGNAQGWIVLAHTYYAMQRFGDAVKAYERATALVPDNADLLADYADALAATQQSLQGKPMELVARALKLDPTQWKALALAAPRRSTGRTIRPRSLIGNGCSNRCRPIPSLRARSRRASPRRRASPEARSPPHQRWFLAPRRHRARHQRAELRSPAPCG
jgi:cytochrome c-type biogenesis protein CcmH